MPADTSSHFSFLRVIAMVVLVPFAVAFLFFFTLGMVGASLSVREFLHTADTYRWRGVPCTVLSNAAQSYMKSSHRGASRRVEVLSVHFKYELADQGYTTNAWIGRSARYPTVGHLRQRYAAGSQHVCFVNPWAPHQAILHRADLWVGFFAIPTLAFALVGGIGVVLFTRAIASAARLKGNEAPWTGPQQTGPWYRDEWLPRIIFGWLFLAECAFLYPLVLEPLTSVARARNWLETPCTVVFGRFDSRLEGEEPVTTGVSFAYTYKVAGKACRGTRYSFVEVPFRSGPYSEAEAARHPSGLTTVCYVDPRDPASAVLRRGLTPDMGWGLVPLAGMAATVLGWRRTHPARLRRGVSPQGV